MQERSPMDAMNVEKHSPSKFSLILHQRTHTELTPLTNAISVRKLPPKSHISLFNRGLTQEKSPTNAVNATKPSADRISLFIREFTLKRSLINATNVGKLSHKFSLISFIRESIQERNPMDAVNVGKISYEV